MRKAEELKKIVKLMCRIIRVHERHGLACTTMEKKWLRAVKVVGNYKRTTNEVPSKNAHYGEAVAGKRSIGFEAMPSIAYHCREDFASKVGLRVGHLTSVFNGNLNGKGLQLSQCERTW